MKQGLVHESGGPEGICPIIPTTPTQVIQMTDDLLKPADEFERKARAVEGDSDNPLRVAAANELYTKAAALPNKSARIKPMTGEPTGDETAWLIEKANPTHPRCTAGLFLSFMGDLSGPITNGALYWSERVHEGTLRFARRIDAEMFIGVELGRSSATPLGQTLPGLRIGDERPLSCEHRWCQ